MHRVTAERSHPLLGLAATRRIEDAASRVLPAHALMQRAGLAVARLAQALAPHARTVWIACGTGNNGGDGLEAAMHLQNSGRRVVVTWLGRPEAAPDDALHSWERAKAAGVQWSDGPVSPLDPSDLCIDALLGIGAALRSGASASHIPHSRINDLLAALHQGPAPVLAVDLPSGLHADTGQFIAGLDTSLIGYPSTALHSCAARHTLSLLTLKPGLFTAAGRDAAGSVWLDSLGVNTDHEPPDAWLSGPALSIQRPHASHKGSYGDVAIVGGEGFEQRGMGMAGAALLAASAALHSGAGRVLVALLDDGAIALHPAQPELMFRRFGALLLDRLTVVCGCGGGQAVSPVLPTVIAQAYKLVLDADALNALAQNSGLCGLVVARSEQGLETVITPHPLEAARLLGLTVAEVQADRLQAAQQLAAQFHCVAVLKGSGTVIAAPGVAPAMNPTGNARLATPGTGDVLAGMVGARMAAGASALHAAREAVYSHGLAADQWPADTVLTASALAVCAGPLAGRGSLNRSNRKHC